MLIELIFFFINYLSIDSCRSNPYPPCSRSKFLLAADEESVFLSPVSSPCTTTRRGLTKRGIRLTGHVSSTAIVRRLTHKVTDSIRTLASNVNLIPFYFCLFTPLLLGLLFPSIFSLISYRPKQLVSHGHNGESTSYIVKHARKYR